MARNQSNHANISNGLKSIHSHDQCSTPGTVARMLPPTTVMPVQTTHPRRRSSNRAVLRNTISQVGSDIKSVATATVKGCSRWLFRRKPPTTLALPQLRQLEQRHRVASTLKLDQTMTGFPHRSARMAMIHVNDATIMTDANVIASPNIQNDKDDDTSPPVVDDLNVIETTSSDRSFDTTDKSCANALRTPIFIHAAASAPHVLERHIVSPCISHIASAIQPTHEEKTNLEKWLRDDNCNQWQHIPFVHTWLAPDSADIHSRQRRIGKMLQAILEVSSATDLMNDILSTTVGQMFANVVQPQDPILFETPRVTRILDEEHLTFELWQQVTALPYAWREIHVSFPLTLFQHPPAESHHHQHHHHARPVVHEFKYKGRSAVILQTERLSERACRHHHQIESLTVLDVVLQSLFDVQGHSSVHCAGLEPLHTDFNHHMKQRLLHTFPSLSDLRSLTHRQVRVQQFHTDQSIAEVWASIPKFGRWPWQGFNDDHVCLVEVLTRGVMDNGVNVEDRRLFALNLVTGTSSSDKYDPPYLLNHVCMVRGGCMEEPVTYFMCLAPFLSHIFERLSMGPSFDPEQLDTNMSMACLSRMCHCREFLQILTNEERDGVRALIVILIQKQVESVIHPLHSSSMHVTGDSTPHDAHSCLHVLFSIEHALGKGIVSPASVLSRLRAVHTY